MALQPNKRWCWLLLWMSVVLLGSLSAWSQEGQSTNSNGGRPGLNDTRRFDSEKDTTEKEKRKTLLTFGLDKVQVLKREVPAGIPLWQYVASFIYILLAFCLSKFLDALTGVFLRKRADRTKTKLDDLFLSVIHGPVKTVSLVLLLYVGLKVFAWPEFINEILRKGLTIAFAITLTYLAIKLIDLMMGYWKARAASDTDRQFNEQLFPLVRNTLRVFVVIAAVLVTTQNIGVNITGLIASLSVGGLALGLAAQDTVANLFGALAVFVDKPFRVGDRIKLDAIDGTVETIGLRSTRVRNLDGYLITVPNKTMGNATITNITRRPNIKTEMNIGLTYDTSTEKLKRALQILEEVYGRHPMTFEVSIGFNKFADSALNISVVHWWKSTDQKAYATGIQEMNLAIKQRFEEEGINFAFPSHTVYMKQDSPWRVDGPKIANDETGATGGA